MPGLITKLVTDNKEMGLKDGGPYSQVRKWDTVVLSCFRPNGIAATRTAVFDISRHETLLGM